MANLFDRIYAASPLWLQNAGVSAYGAYWHWIRFGHGFQRYQQEYISRNSFSELDWPVWQQSRLKQILNDSLAYVPYYRQHWSEGEKAAARDGCLVDLPLLGKDSIRQNPYQFVHQGTRPRPVLMFPTSGSTGTPITTLWTVQEYRNALALREVRSAQWAGVSFALPRATFSGRIAEPDPNSKGPYHRFNIIEHQVYFSAFHLRAETASAYVRALRDHGVQWITGYAVSIFLLAQHILDQRLPVPDLKAIITTSEKVTDQMRQVMQKAFNCRVFEEYSTVENALFASECEQGRLHVSPDVAIVEILRRDGTPCGPEEIGEVVATCLMRRYQPFIRYRLGDLAAWSAERCPCGRAMPVIKEVVGRVEDIVVGPDGRQMVRFHGIFVNQPHIREGQIIQETLDRIRVKIVPTDGFGPSDINDIVHRIQQRLGPQVNVTVEQVGSIPRTKAGKFKAVVSLLKGN